MEKGINYTREKRFYWTYMIIAILAGLFFSIKLYQGFYGESDDIPLNPGRIKLQNFVDFFFTLNPSMAFIAADKGSPYNTLISSYSFPILTFAMSERQQPVTDVLEIYPFLSQEQAYVNKEDIFIQDEIFTTKDSIIISSPVTSIDINYEQMNNLDFLFSHLYTIDTDIQVTLEDLNIKHYMENPVAVDLTKKGPKILICHTHSQESFADSQTGVKEDTVVGVGDELTRILEDEYGIEVYHLREEYDMIDGRLDRSKAYELIEKDIVRILTENPTIEVLIDIHRDGIPENMRLIETINGKQTARIMFFNGISKTMQNGVMKQVAALPNPYVKENMAFSFQMQLMANELFPVFAKKIYINGYRYNLHLLPYSLLVEAGAQTNTVEEAKNAMEPLAKILYEVLR